ncbi:phosphatase PAP2 family protein [Thalassotalea insulae]|nr:phosphatase PAP2 family protein [Thalassotalea insulae]
MFESIYQADLRLLMWCQKSRFYPQFIAFIRAISRTGDGYLQVLFPLLYLLVNPIQGAAFFQLAITAYALERPLYFVLKNILKRRRPPDVVPAFTSIIHASDKFSFPSGHTMAAFLLAGLAVATIGLAACGLYLWAIAVAISRVILGVHFPTDIIAGATLGSLVAYLMVVV